MTGCVETNMNQEIENQEDITVETQPIEEVLPYYDELIITKNDNGEKLFSRLTDSGIIISNPEQVDWGMSRRIIVAYDKDLIEMFPPAFFSINQTIVEGEVLNVYSGIQHISFIYPSSHHGLSTLANITLDDLFVREGLLLIDNYFIKSGTIVILDHNTSKHSSLFKENSDVFTTTAVNDHFRLNRYENILYVYVEEPPFSLSEFNPTRLPEVSNILEFNNYRGQRVMMANLNERFMIPMIQSLIAQWGSTYDIETPIFPPLPSISEEVIEYALPPEICRIPNTFYSNVRSGFPLNELRVSTLGSVRAKVVYLDFLDYRQNPNGPSLNEQFASLGEQVNSYIEAVSYGRMNYEWDIHPEPLLMPKNVGEYNLTRSGDRDGYFPTLEIVYEMLDLYRDEIDFTDVEVIVVMFNQSIPFHLADVSPAHPVGENRPFITNQGNIYNAVTIGSDWPDHKWQVIVHELAHTMGLIDLYDYGPQDEWIDHHRHVGGFDIMGAYQDNLEFLGWNRYLMGWVEDEKIYCLDSPKEPISLRLQTIGKPSIDSGKQMVIIPLDTYKVLVIEAKEQNPFCLSCDGLLVYTVDTTIANGRGSIKVIPVERSSDIFKNDAMIRVGESIAINDLLIKLENATPDGYQLNIGKSS